MWVGGLGWWWSANGAPVAANSPVIVLILAVPPSVAEALAPLVVLPSGVSLRVLGVGGGPSFFARQCTGAGVLGLRGRVSPGSPWFVPLTL